MRAVVAVSPALSVLILTIFISFVTGHPKGLFLTYSIEEIILRFLMVTLTLLAPLPILPKFLVAISNLVENAKIFGQLVKTPTSFDRGFNKTVAWVIRPFQGIGLSIILAERFLSFFELSLGLSYTILLVGSILL